MKSYRFLWLLALLAAVLVATVHYSPSRVSPPRAEVAAITGGSHSGGGRGSSMPRAPSNPRPPQNPAPVYHPPAGPGGQPGHPTYPNPPAWSPTQQAAIDTMRQHIVGTTFGLHSIRSQGTLFGVPSGGWVTGWHQRFPGLRSCYLHPYRMRPCSVVGCVDFWTPYWGIGWYDYPFGFYWGDDFWFGIWSGPVYWPDYVVVPIYVMSPISQVEVGQLTPPPGGFTTDTQAELSMLRMMASPSALDETAGLYDGSNGFDPAAPGYRLSGDAAYGLLRQGLPVYYHPPQGAFERINNLTELHTYLYTPEAKQAAPPQEPDRGSP